MEDKDQVYRKALKLFQKSGIESISSEKLIEALGLGEENYSKYFADKRDLVAKAIRQDIEDQKARQEEIHKKATNAVHEILLMLQDGLNNLEGLNPDYVGDLMDHYPEAMAIAMDSLYSHSYNQMYTLLNDGIRQGVFRKDINMEIVTKIILENINVMINRNVFPPQRYDIKEVYRCIYLYYIRGLCTEEAIKLTEQFFTAG